MAGIARVNVDLSDGPNALVVHRSPGERDLAPPVPLPLLYHGGSGVDQVTWVARSSGSVVDGGGGDDRLSGIGGRYLGGPGNDAINVQDLELDGAGELTLADGGDGDDTLVGSSPVTIDPNDATNEISFAAGHLIGGPGNDQVGGRIAEGGEGDDLVSGIFIDAGPGDDTISARESTQALDCGTGVERWARHGRPSYLLRADVVHSDCPPFLATERELGAMRFDRRNRLLVPLRFTEAVQFSGMFVNFGRPGHAFVHRLKVRVPEQGRVFRLRIKPKALEAMRSRGRRAYVGIAFTARDSQGERTFARWQDFHLDGYALRPRRR